MAQERGEVEVAERRRRGAGRRSPRAARAARPRSSRARVRGCSGRTTGRRQRRAAAPPARAGGRGRRRCRRGARSPAGLPGRHADFVERRTALGGAVVRKTSATSTITSPTSSTRPATCSRSRLATAVGDGHSSSELRWSVSTRLTSSGMRRSNERMPASTWATGTPACAPPARRRAWSSCRRRPARDPARARRRGRPAPPSCAPSGTGWSRSGCPARSPARAPRARRRRSRDSSSSWCWPVWTSTSSSARAAARETAAALMNCGRLPMTVRPPRRLQLAALARATRRSLDALRSPRRLR